MAASRLSDVELLARLVAIDTTSDRSNLPLVDLLADYLEAPATAIELDRSEDGEKANLVVRLGPEVDPESRRGLVLSGHLDTVPADPSRWRTDPFELVEGEDRWTARGSTDMKGFVALATNLAAEVAGDALRHPLVLIFTYDEEVGTVGAGDLVARWPEGKPLPRRAIVGEPTSLQAVRLHKGHGKVQLTVRGESAHSAYPHLGHSAIEPAARAVTALGELRQALRQETWPNSDHFSTTPYVSLNVGTIHGGSAVNVVPDTCSLAIGFRTLPGVEASRIAERIAAAIEPPLDGEDYELDALQESPALLLEESNDFYGDLCTLLGQRQTVSVDYASDAGWLQRLGLDCVLLGPGSIEVAHKPDEWVPKDELSRTPALLRQLVERYCRSG